MVDYRFDNVLFDTKNYELRRDMKVVRLQRQPSKVLEYLIQNAGRWVSTTELDACWPGPVTEDVLKAVIYRLRNSLEEIGCRRDMIQSLRREGYRFNAVVIPKPAASSNGMAIQGQAPHITPIVASTEELLREMRAQEEVFRSPVRDLVTGEAGTPTTRNSAVAHTFTMLSLGIEMAAKQYHAALLDLLMDHSPPIVPPAGDWYGNLEWFVNNAEIMERVDWSHFARWPRSNPLIDAFWTCAELRDAVPVPVYTNIAGLMYNYSAHYLCGDVLWIHGPVAQTVAFFVDTAAVINIKEPTLALLDARNRQFFDKLVEIIVKHAQRSLCWGDS